MKIISRQSTLAKIQARLVADKINTKVDDFKFELITKETSGDIDLDFFLINHLGCFLL